MDSPLHHFELHPIINLSVGGLDLSINKAVIAMWVGLVLVFGLFKLGSGSGRQLIPGKLQSVLEIAMEFIQGMVDEFIGKEEGKKYFSFVASLFILPMLGAPVIHHNRTIQAEVTLFDSQRIEVKNYVLTATKGVMNRKWLHHL